MRRGGSVSFVVEVKRRRFPQQSATTSDLDRGSASYITPIAVGASSVAPLIERKRGSDPTIEAAKIAAKRFFSKLSSSHSARADNWSDPTAPGSISRLEPARVADMALPSSGPSGRWAFATDRSRRGRDRLDSTGMS
jgi:hypothetical protein